MKIAVTGHRPNKLNNEYDGVGICSTFIRNEIKAVLAKHTQNGQTLELISGMALGVDMLFAQIAIELNIPLIAAIPFKGQQSMWPKQSQDRFNKILSYDKCESVIVSEGAYTPQKMQIRNQWMVDNCDLLIAVFDGTSGGTANCVNYAKKIGKNRVVIKPTGYKNV